MSSRGLLSIISYNLWLTFFFLRLKKLVLKKGFFMDVSVVGLGKLGSPIAAVLASKGHKVFGVDLNQHFVDSINSAKAPVQEPSLTDLFEQYSHSIEASTNYKRAILHSSITLIILPTPSDENGRFINDFLLQAVESIGSVLQEKDSYHLIVIKSTVMPGSMDGVICKALAKTSNKIVGQDIGLCYSPEFIALGSVIKNLKNPDLILIGQSDQKAGDLLESLYHSVVENQPKIKRMNFINAEITKLAINTYVTTKISYANMISEVCENLPFADCDEVLSAVGLDSRIGHKYLKGAVAYGGPCFPRDNMAFRTLANNIGARSDLAQATDQINEHQLQRLYHLIKAQDIEDSVCILGLSYKPDTCVVDESPGISLANYFIKRDFKVNVFDPLALNEARKVLDADINIHETISQAIESSSCIVIMTASKEFSDQISNQLINGKTVIDCWRILPQANYTPYCNLVYLGKGDSKELTFSGASYE